jgi:hypothetical protein
MLRNGHEDTATRHGRLAHLIEDELVLAHMLEHVERADNVELGVERDPPPVHLEDLGARNPAPCDLHARVERISCGDAQAGQAPLQLGGHVAGAAAHLQEADSGREVRLQRPRDERVARAKPEAPVLDILQMVEGFLEEALLAREVGREPQVAVVLGREAA